MIVEYQGRGFTCVDSVSEESINELRKRHGSEEGKYWRACPSSTGGYSLVFGKIDEAPTDKERLRNAGNYVDLEEFVQTQQEEKLLDNKQLFKPAKEPQWP